jgi:hypothetical protein
MEQGRVECEPGEIHAYFQEVAKVVDVQPTALIFNLDESSFQDRSHKDDEIRIPVDRTAKRRSHLVCIPGDGTDFGSFVLILRKTIESELMEQGVSSALATMA